MCGILAALFIVIPAVELYVLIEVGSRVGAPLTLVMLIAMGAAGAALARHQGLAAARTLRTALVEGREVAASIVEAALVLVAAVLMLAPGFLTDVAGILMLVPPVRRRVARAVATRYAERAAAHIVIGPMGPRAHSGDDDPPPPGVIDV